MNRIAVLLPLALAGLLVTTAIGLPRAAAQTGAACDRACLTGIADTSVRHGGRAHLQGPKLQDSRNRSGGIITAAEFQKRVE